MKRKKGSAMVFTVLILGFFLAIALNILFLSQKKGERAAHNIHGERVSSAIELSSTLGYYELYLADQYLTKGFLYRSGGDNSSYYTNEIQGATSGTSEDYIVAGDSYEGINIPRYLDYFTSHWENTITPKIRADIDINIGEKKVIVREWLQQNDNITRLWLLNPGINADEAFSIGGYRIYQINLNGDTVPIYNLYDGDSLTDLSGVVRGDLVDNQENLVTILLEKEVYIDDTDLGRHKFRITAMNRILLDGITFNKNDDVEFGDMVNAAGEEISEVVVERLY